MEMLTTLSKMKTKNTTITNVSPNFHFILNWLNPLEIRSYRRRRLEKKRMTHWIIVQPAVTDSPGMFDLLNWYSQWYRMHNSQFTVHVIRAHVIISSFLNFNQIEFRIVQFPKIFQLGFAGIVEGFSSNANHESNGNSFGYVHLKYDLLASHRWTSLVHWSIC